MPSLKAFPVRVENVILCDSVRGEMNGKHSIMGAFAGDIIVTSLPGHIPISIYIELYSDIVRKIELVVAINYDRKEIARGDLLIDFEDVKKPSVVGFPTFPLFIDRPGTIQVYLHYNGARRAVLKKEVILGTLPLPTAPTAWPQQPSQSQTAVPAKASRRGKRPPSDRPSGGEL